jgi:hypothetical protein
MKAKVKGDPETMTPDEIIAKLKECVGFIADRCCVYKEIDDALKVVPFFAHDLEMAIRERFGQNTTGQ